MLYTLIEAGVALPVLVAAVAVVLLGVAMTMD